MEVKFGGKTYKKSKYSGIDGNTVVSFVDVFDMNKVEARKDGMVVELRATLTNDLDAGEFLHEIRELMLAGWKERNALKPKLETNLSGH